MRIAVVGAGGVGGYFGGLLARGGQDVTFLARGEHLQAIRARGLRVVSSTDGEFVISPARAESDPARVGVVDYVLVAVKAFQLEAAAPTLSPLLGRGTTVIPLINGVEAHDVLRSYLPAEAIVGGLCGVFSQLESPGVIRREGRARRVIVGEFDGPPSERLDHIVAVWEGQGADAVQSDDIRAALWTKFLFIASMGGITSLARATAGEVRSAGETRSLLVEAFREVETVARAQGIHLEADVVEETLAMVDGLEPEVTTSMQRDVVAARPFELEAFSGTVVRLGRALNVPTPVHEAVYALLLPMLKQR